MAAPFYVYAFWNDDNSLAYIGKGSGGRFRAQQRRFRRDGINQGSIIWESESERRSYRMERALIARHKPPLNRSAGGCGGKHGMSTHPRIVAARALARKGREALRSYGVSDDQFEVIHRVASCRNLAEVGNACAQ